MMKELEEKAQEVTFYQEQIEELNKKNGSLQEEQRKLVASL